MNSFRRIRAHLRLTQVEIADAMDTTQVRISRLENAAQLSPAWARRLIMLAHSRGMVIDWNHIYGDAELPGASDASARRETAAAKG